MAVISQKEAAKRFSKKWAGQGKERQDDSKFWLELLSVVFRIEDPFKLIEFQKPVKMDSSTRFIDAFIPETRVLIEQKGVDIDLSKKYQQSGGDMLTPYEQARRYDQWMLPDEHPLWIVVCNFQSFEIHDMRHPFDAPEIVLLENLADEYTRLSFITDADRMHIQREQKVSMDAGKIVGRIYDALQKQYLHPDDESTKHSLNVLCVRLVFCLYAEDAGIFSKDQFHDYLKDIPVEDMRESVLKLFEVLDTPEAERSPYLKEKLKAFPYTNGGLFHDKNIEVPMFTDEIKNVLVEHASDDFDWSAISPTIFGGVFESTLNPETRRGNGMHYTSIENIHKVIDPLFLDDLKDELQKHKDSRPAPGSSKQKLQEWKQTMVEFQEKLASLKFMDPACGSGNFLTETYLSLRRLENDIIRELNDGNMNLGLEDEIIKVQISQFYGIEINDFAADVARTALWISEAQMMDETRDIVQKDMDFLPLKSNSNIRTGNALKVDWNEVIPAAELNYLYGNPPFVGYKFLTKAQKEDIQLIAPGARSFDYVVLWYYKALDYMKGTDIIASFVSTNSICQGDAIQNVWEGLIQKGIVIQYAWQTFVWDNEANVHCVIVGFSRGDTQRSKFIFKENEAPIPVSKINPYLVEGDNIILQRRGVSLCGMPDMTKGAQLIDGGGFMIEGDDERDQFIRKYPEAEPYIYRYYNSQDFINNNPPRYCLYLQHCPPSIIRNCKGIYDKVEAVRQYRAGSDAESTRVLAETPSRFFQPQVPEGNSIIVPVVSSAARRYIPMSFMPAGSVFTNALFYVDHADIYLFGILTSSTHMAWTNIICGRLKSDYRYSNSIVYNNFPFPAITPEQKAKIEFTAQGILNARALYPDSSLADLYDEISMPIELRKAHKLNDAAVMEAYGFRKDMTEPEIVAELFKMYQNLTND